MDQKLLERRIEEVEEATGSGTAMVSLYVSAGTNLASEKKRMSQEKSEAANIKSKQNRKNVEDAIDRVGDLLKNYKQTPENGLVIFVGVTREGAKKFVFDNLPQRLDYSDYTCDSRFHTDPLREMVAPDHTVGLLVVERGGCAIGELRGTSIHVHYDEESNVMGKHNAGGQCLDPNTTVPMSDGQPKRIGDINVGDRILGLGSENQEIVNSTVMNRWVSEKQTYTIHTKDPQLKIKISGDHTVFLLGDSGIQERYASDLKEGDTLLYPSALSHPDRQTHRSWNSEGYANNVVTDTQGGQKLNQQAHQSYPEEASVIGNADIKPTVISKIETDNETSRLIDIETSTSNFFANGILVHNSAERFDRLIEEQRDNYFGSVSSKLQETFVNSDNQSTVDGFVIGGTQITVDNFVSDGYLPQPLRDVRIGGSYSIDIASSESLGRLVEKAKSEIQSVAEQEEREYMDRFFRALHDNSDDEATFGNEKVMQAIEYGAVEAVLVSENIDRELIVEYEERVKNQGGELVVISDDFAEGEQFWKGFDGLGALLRYRVE